ncbi:IS91 family transposase [Alicyclobacillus mengziensis]|uniref:IS91 family transposase n=1 Tax=Alicyclobacillus mengziensis TaxID=2931921 RepID=A0A9X7VVQ1_9BACL|nr:IS91 family transposase [Alicyclobacillus mengziensis]QSO45449.1 IS91 family transposase [Alicyclobacillus mengziensis]
MPELQDIFLQYGGPYQLAHGLSLEKRKVVQAIQSCRTAVLGGHVDECDECGFIRISYNSCRNRHCPKCQTLTKVRWIEARKADLLNVGYFHVVFTLPDLLNPVAYQNPKVVYSILFKAAAETLSELASDPKYLGGQIGLTAVLHTWGQNLMHHPHLHCIVPGGGLNSYGKWVNSRKKFFIPVKVLSRKFRGKFLNYLKQAKLEFYGSIVHLHDQNQFQQWISSLYQKEWVVYCKPPFKDPGHVVEYLGRYTHRVAISNNRIVRVHNGMVTFKWRDYKDHNRQKLMSLTTDEFIRRFLVHVLPTGFMRIRHYGLLSPRNKSVKLALCKKLTKTTMREKFTAKLSTVELFEKLTGRDFTLCPCCGIGHLTRASPENATA